MFGKSSFNHTAFGRTNDDTASLYATIASQYEVTAPLRVLVLITDVTISAETAVEVAPLGLYAPLPAIDISSRFDVSGALHAMMPLPEIEIGAEYRLDAAAIRTAESEEMVLEGLNLEPGQSLIIDTDTLEIEVNGEVRVDCWVTGGTFFQLKAGDNLLTFEDNLSQRELVVTVLWADRYL